MIEILVVDDHALVREGLRWLIDAQTDMHVAGEAQDAEVALAQAATLRPHVIVLDLSLPGRSGVEIARDLRASCPDAALVALTRHDDLACVREMFSAGALGYVLKRSTSRELLAAIRAAAAGRRYLDTGLLRGPVAQALGRATEPTERERAVLQLAAQGHSHKEIATTLGIAEKTVETHKANGMRKLNLRDRADLMRYAALSGWLRAS